MRIKFIVPFPLDREGLERRGEQIIRACLRPETEVVCVPVRNSFDPEAVRAGGTYYEAMLMDMYVAEAALSAGEEGFDAVVMDTVSDSGLYPLRSRLTIPVVGPGLVSYCIAMMLGKRFSIITYGSYHKFLYEKNLDTYNLWAHCASIRAADITPDFDELFSDDSDEEFRKLTEVARSAIEEDGADVILLGSTTMHQAGDYMTEHLAAPVVNPGPVALKMTEALLDLGLAHSKVGFPTPGTIQDDKWLSLIGASVVGES